MLLREILTATTHAESLPFFSANNDGLIPARTRAFWQEKKSHSTSERHVLTLNREVDESCHLKKKIISLHERVGSQ